MAAPLIPATWQLPDYFRGRLGTAIGRQRVMQHGEQLLLLAHEVPSADEITRRGLLFWYDGQQWQSSTGHPGKIAIANLIQAYAKQIDTLDQQEAQARQALDYLPLLDGLAPVMRSARNLYEVLQEARTSAPQLRELIDFRDQMYELSRTAELLYQDAKNSMDVAVIRRAEEQAQASYKMSVAAHRLNSMAALFFPLATLGAVFGTTLTDNWSWSRSIGPFVGFVLFGLLTGLLLAIFVRRTSK